MNRPVRRWLLGCAVLALAGAVLVAWRMPEVAAWQWYLAAGKPTMSSVKRELSGELHWADDYYVVGDLGGGAYAIGEPRYGQCNFSYLIVGTERALLFDTGPGVRDISPVVRSLTTLPVTALPSHLHFDHVGDLSKFADIALPDLPALRAQVHDGIFSFRRYQFLGFVEGFRAPELRIRRWIAPDSDFDLGGRVLRVINLPGHTPDSVVLLDRMSNRAFAGDFIYPSEIYAFLPGANLGDYAASATRLARQLKADSAVYGGHGCDRPSTVEVPRLTQADVMALSRAVAAAANGNPANVSGIYPRESPINERMKLLAKYPWMSH